MTDRRWLRWQACYNVRDLGGLPLSSGGETRERVLVRADSLCRLTERGKRDLAAHGVRTVIDLRWPKEVAAEPHPFANGASGEVRYLHLPLLNDATEEGLREAKSAAEAYARILDGCRPEFARVLDAVGAATEGAVVVHCAGGKDRTGLVAALLLALAGVPDRAIAEDYALTDVGLRPVHDEWIAKAEDPDERARRAEQVKSRPETMLAALAHVESRYGGVEALLRGAGLGAERVDILRDRLRP